MIAAKRTIKMLIIVASMLSSCVFYVMLLRTYGATPIARDNRDRLVHLQGEMDSLRTEVEMIKGEVVK